MVMLLLYYCYVITVSDIYLCPVLQEYTHMHKHTHTIMNGDMAYCFLLNKCENKNWLKPSSSLVVLALT